MVNCWMCFDVDFVMINVLFKVFVLSFEYIGNLFILKICLCYLRKLEKYILLFYYLKVEWGGDSR